VVPGHSCYHLAMVSSHRAENHWFSELNFRHFGQTSDMSYPNPHAARCETVEQSQHLVPPTEIATSLALLVMTEEEKLLAMAFPYCHCKPFTRVILSSSLCHSERAKRPKNLAQGKLPRKISPCSGHRLETLRYRSG